jgi:hypothetical protein
MPLRGLEIRRDPSSPFDSAQGRLSRWWGRQDDGSFWVEVGVLENWLVPIVHISS